MPHTTGEGGGGLLPPDALQLILDLIIGGFSIFGGGGGGGSTGTGSGPLGTSGDTGAGQSDPTDPNQQPQEGDLAILRDPGELILAGVRIIKTFPEGGTTVEIPGVPDPIQIPPDCTVTCEGGPPVGFGQFIQELGSAAIDVGSAFLQSQFQQPVVIQGGGGFPTGGFPSPTVTPAGGMAFDFPTFPGALTALPEIIGGGLPPGIGQSVPVQACGNLFQRTPSGRTVANRMVRVTNPGTGKDQYFLPAMPKTWKTPVRGVSGPRRHHHHPR